MRGYIYVAKAETPYGLENWNEGGFTVGIVAAENQLEAYAKAYRELIEKVFDPRIDMCEEYVTTGTIRITDKETGMQAQYITGLEVIAI